MKYPIPTNHKSDRNRADKSQQAKSVPAKEHWLDDIDEQQDSGPRLSSSVLHALSRKGLWGLLLFLLASVAAFMVQDFNLYKSLPESVLQIIGCAPPAILIHLALTGYSFTVVVPVLIRMATGDSPVVRWHHLACRTVFYLFYLASTTLPENFMAVFILGVMLYTLEQIGIWAYLYRNLREAAVSG